MASNKPSLPVIAAILAAHGAVAALTWRDLRSRSKEEVRGPKRWWQIASALNTAGSVAYWVAGRRPQATA